jgi:hypothetical protein
LVTSDILLLLGGGKITPRASPKSARLEQSMQLNQAELPKAKTVEDFEALLPFNTAPHSQLPLTRNTAVFRSQRDDLSPD